MSRSTPELDRPAADVRPRARRKSRWWMLLVPLVGLFGLAWFAPAIVAGTSLRQQILPMIVPQFAGSFSLDAASLGWTSPVVLTSITARDPQGQPLFIVREVRTEEPLWQLISDRTKVGRVLLSGVAVNAVLSESSSNIEQAIAPMLNAPATSPTPAMQITVQEGTIEISDMFSGRAAKLTNLGGDFLITGVPGALPQARLQCVLSDETRGGNVLVELNAPVEGNEPPPAMLLHVVTEAMPLRPTSSVLRRFIGPSELSGDVTGDMLVRYRTAPSAAGQAVAVVDIAGKAQGRDLTFAAASLLRNDVLRASAANFEGQISFDDQYLAASNVVLASDLGRVNLNGRAPLAVLQGRSPNEIAQTVEQNDFHFAGEIDLARLAAALPDTLRIREGTQITAGTVQVALDSVDQQGQRVFTGKISTSDITAQASGRPIRWQQPLLVQLAAHRPAGGEIVIDRLTCQSTFLGLIAQGKRDDATVAAQADLNKLAAELGQFVDLAQLQMAGTAKLNLRLERGADERVALTSTGEVLALQLVLPGAAPWREEKLTFEANALARVPRNRTNIAVQTAKLAMTSGSDSLTATLRQPVENFSATTPLPLDIAATGQLETWIPRLQSVISTNGWQMAGAINLAAQVSATAEQVDVAQSQLDLTNLEAQGPNPSDFIREQLARFTAAGSWQRATGRIAAQQLTVATTSWSLRGDNIVVQPVAQGLPETSGNFSLLSDLRRTLDTRRRPGDNTKSTTARGQTQLNFTLAVAQGVTTANVTGQIDNLVVEAPLALPPASGVQPASVATAMQTLWAEQQLKLKGTLQYRHADDLLQLSGVEVAGSGLALKTQGNIASVQTKPVVHLEGAADYNLALLANRFRPLIGNQIQLAGLDSARFTLDGPLLPEVAAAPATNNGLRDSRTETAPAKLLVSPLLVGTGQFGWDQVGAYGVVVGKGRLSTELRRGIIDFQPLTVPVSDGRMNLSPRIYLNENPAALTLDRGPLLENVQITPQMFRSWLMYITPLLADATDCQGRASVTLERAIFPLASPASGQVAGTLTLHGADVRPGALANQYIGLAQQIRSLFQQNQQASAAPASPITLVHLDEQELRVEMINGRIHHRGLKMKIGDVTATTSGSVGLDQTLDLVIAVPIQDDWLKGSKIVGSFAGQTVQIPIKGTIGRPAIDRSALDNAARQMVTGAASRLLNREVNNLLDGLLRPPAAQGNSPQATGPQNPAGTNATQTGQTSRPSPLTPDVTLPENQRSAMGGNRAGVDGTSTPSPQPRPSSGTSILNPVPQGAVP